MQFVPKRYVARPTLTEIFADVVPEDVNVDVLTDQFPGAGPGDYIETDAEGKPLRSWPKAEFEAAWMEPA